MDFLPDVIDPHFLLVQGLGFVGFILFAISFQLLNPRHTTFLQAVANVFLVIHFFALGQVFIAALSILASLRNLGSSFLRDRHHKMLMVAYVPTLCGMAFLFEAQAMDWLSVLASNLITVGQFFRDRFYVFRFLNVMPELLWLIVYVYVGSWSGVAFATLFVLSNFVGVIRYMRKVDLSKGT